MPIIGTNIASSVAGVANAERIAAKAVEKREAKAGPRRRAEADEVIVGAEATESAEAARSLKSNDQEEAREDHEEHPAYSPQGAVKEPAPPRIDMSA